MAVKRTWIVIPILLAVGIAAGGYAYYRQQTGDRADADALTLYGNIDIRQVDVAFNVAGRIDTMAVEEGDTVSKGDLLASLDDERYRDAVDAARATVNARQAALARLQAGSRPEEIAQARARVNAAEGTWKTAQANLHRQKQLARDSYASAQALEDARAKEQTARGNLDALQQALTLAIKGPREEDIAQAKADLGAARAQLALAQHQLDDTRLRAPVEGTVITRVQQPGAVILANTPVYTIALSSPVWVRTYVSEPDLGRVEPGMAARITTDSAPERPYRGWVGFISPTAEFTPKTVQTPDIRTSLVYRLRVYADNPDGGLRQGMPVTIELLPGEKRRQPPAGSAAK